MSRSAEMQDQVREIAWMHYIGGLSQAEIAERRGLSRMKVHRLVQAAHDKGMVRFFVDEVTSSCLDVENRLMARYGLSSCTVAPDSGLPGMMESAIPVVAVAGAAFLLGRLEPTEPMVFGIGSGRTMAEVVRHLPVIRRRKAEFVSATGDFAALSSANPFEVINTLILRTGGSGYALTAPLVVDSEADRDLFMRQRSIRAAQEKLATASLVIGGIGHIGPGSFLQSFGLVTEAEMAELSRSGATADLLGNLLDEEGRAINTAISRRMISIDRDLLAEREVVAVVGGTEKWRATRSVLRSGFLNGIITTQALAEKVLAED